MSGRRDIVVTGPLLSVCVYAWRRERCCITVCIITVRELSKRRAPCLQAEARKQFINLPADKPRA